MCKKLISIVLCMILVFSTGSLLVADAQNNLNSVLGIFEGEYTAYQGVTALTLSIHEKTELLGNESLLQKYADVATECSKNREGVPSKIFTADEIRAIVEAHSTDVIAFYNFYPTVGNPDVEEGLYTMTVEYDSATDTYDFKGSQWIQRHTYVFAHLINVELKDDKITGNVYTDPNGYQDCGDVSINRANGKSTYRVEFSNKNVTVGVNEQVNVSVTVKDDYMKPAEMFTNISWISSNPKIAIIEGENWGDTGQSANAVITGVSPGVTTVSAVIENQRIATCTVVVSDTGIMLPLEVFLNYELTSTIDSYKVDDVTTVFTYKPQYQITATVYNSSNLSADDVKIDLNLPNKMNLNTDSQSKSVALGTLAPGESKTTTWNVSVDVEIHNYHSVRYSVTVKDSLSFGIEKYQTIFINPFVPENNAVNLGIDTWSFYNTSIYFPNGYQVDSGLYKALEGSITNIEKTRIDDYIASDWKGSCFGMSAIVALNKLNRFDIESLDSSADCLYDLSYKNESVISTINYYHVLQSTDIYLSEYKNNANLDTKTRLANFVDSVENVEFGGMPVLLLVSFLEQDYNIHKLGNSFPGHALVAYDVEYGSYTIDNLVGSGKHTYNTRVTVYDPSNSKIKKPIYMYIDAEEERWLLEGWCQNQTSDDGLYWFAREGYFNYIDNEEIFNLYYTGDTKRNYRAALTSRFLTDITVRQSGYEKFRMNGINVLNNPRGITVVPAFNGSSSGVTYLIDDYSNEYEILPTTPNSKLDIDFSYENVSYSIESESCLSVNVSEYNKFNVNECSGKYTVRVTFNDNIVNSPWYSFTASGSDCENIGMSLAYDNMLLLEGDNLNNVVFTVKNDDVTLSEIITTDYTSVLIGKDENSLEFYVDTDGDGEYEKKLEKPKYEVDLKKPENGKAKVEEDCYHAGENVTIEVVPEPGFVLEGIYVDGEKIEGNTFTMPAHDVEVVVEFVFSLKAFIKTPTFILGAIGIVALAVAIPVCVSVIKKKSKKSSK